MAPGGDRPWQRLESVTAPEPMERGMRPERLPGQCDRPGRQHRPLNRRPTALRAALQGSYVNPWTVLAVARLGSCFSCRKGEAFAPEAASLLHCAPNASSLHGRIAPRLRLNLQFPTQNTSSQNRLLAHILEMNNSMPRFILWLLVLGLAASFAGPNTQKCLPEPPTVVVGRVTRWHAWRALPAEARGPGRANRAERAGRPRLEGRRSRPNAGMLTERLARHPGRT